MLVSLGPTSWVLGIGVASFTLASGLASFLLLILNFMNGQYFNYVSLLAAVVSLDKFNAFGQQLYTLFNFAEIEKKSYDMAIEYFRCRGEENLPLFTAPDKVSEISISVFLYLINTQGLLFFYWSLILFSSSWSLQPIWWKSTRIVTLTKLSCFLLPGIQLVLLRIPPIRDSDIWSLIVMNAIILINIGMASIFLLLTLIHVLHIHIRARGGTRIRLSRTYDGVIEYIQSPIPPSPLHGIRKFLLSSDGWLIGRIILAFLMVEGLQIYMIVMQIFFLNKWAHFKLEWQNGLKEPVVDQAEEFANLCSPIPASFTGFLMLGVFGTTVESRQAFGRLVRAVLCMKRRKEVWQTEVGKGKRGDTPESEWNEEEKADLDVKTRIHTPVPSPRIPVPKGPAPTYRFTPSPTLSGASTPAHISKIQKSPSTLFLAPPSSQAPSGPIPPINTIPPPFLDATDPAVLATFQFRFGGSISSTQSLENRNTSRPASPILASMFPNTPTDRRFPTTPTTPQIPQKKAIPPQLYFGGSISSTRSFESRSTTRSASTVSASMFPDTPTTHLFPKTEAITPRSGTTGVEAGTASIPFWVRTDKREPQAVYSPVSPLEKTVTERMENMRREQAAGINVDLQREVGVEIVLENEEVRQVCIREDSAGEGMVGSLTMPWSGPDRLLRGESYIEPLSNTAYSPTGGAVTPGGTRKADIRWPWSEEEEDEEEEHGHGLRKDSVPYR